MVSAIAAIVAVVSQPIVTRLFAPLSTLERSIGLNDSYEVALRKTRQAETADYSPPFVISDNEHGYIPGAQGKWVTVEHRFLGQDVALLIEFDGDDHVKQKSLKLDGGT
jgi:hypothetical protein